MYPMDYTKNCHNLTIFDNYSNFMHHGENLENTFHQNFVIDDGLCPNLALCCEINAHMNDRIVQQNIVLICKTLSCFYNSNKRTKKYYI
jgi:hypothetical protein